MNDTPHLTPSTASSTASPTAPRAGRRRPRGPLDVGLGVLAVLLHVAAFWLVTVSGLMIPLWAILALGVVWLGSCFPLVRTVRGPIRWAVSVPLAFLALWLAVVTFGDLVLGWTA